MLKCGVFSLELSPITCHSDLRSQAISFRYGRCGSDTTTQTQGCIFKCDAWTQWKLQLILPPLRSLTLYLRRELPIKELSLVRIISIIIPQQKRHCNIIHFTRDFILDLSPLLIAFHSCKIIWDMYCQLSRTVGQYILPRTLTCFLFYATQ